jgi:hypothetical protein
MATEQAVGVGGGDAGRRQLSGNEVENGSPSQSRQENNRQEADTEGTGSRNILTLAGICHPSDFDIGAVESPLPILTFGVIEGTSAATPYPLSPPPRVVDEATRSDPSTTIQGALNRKRARSSTQPTVLPDDGAPRKRPRRATKETWKAREAREARQA